ncbi:hypothetical protein RYX56_23905, partial [Alkalihalophilus lindianensis]
PVVGTPVQSTTPTAPLSTGAGAATPATNETGAQPAIPPRNTNTTGPTTTNSPGAQQNSTNAQ